MKLAEESPLLWLQLHQDMETAKEKANAEQGPQWKKPGERAVDARDRLREEREEAKRRLRG